MEDDHAKQTQLLWSGWKGQVLGKEGVMMIWPRKAPWQNKANFLRVGEGPEDCSRQCRAARACQTKPIGGEWSRQTKPVGRRGVAGRNIPAFPLFQYSIIPAFQSDADHAKQTQTWAGWVIWGTVRGRGDCAKQSQFAATGKQGQVLHA